MRNFKPTKVVALDQAGQPVVRALSQWSARLNHGKNTLTLSSGTHRLSYDLSRDVRYLAVVDQKQEVDLGKTLGRMALTGIGVNGFEHGKGVAGAVMELATRGTSNTAWLLVEIVLTDLSVVRFEARPEQINEKPELLRAAGEEARRKLEAVNDVLRRLRADGERTLPELEQTISVLQAEAAQHQREAEAGQTFALRDAARAKLASIDEQIADKSAVRVALLVDWKLEKRGPLHGLGRRIAKTIAWIAVAFAAFTAFMFYATQKPDTQARASAAAPSGSSAPLPPSNLESASFGPTVGPTEPAQAASDPPVQAMQPVESSAIADAHPPSRRLSNPSFNCAEAVTRVEKMICGDVDLGYADRKMAVAFREALRASATPNDVRRAQATWRRDQRDACAAPSCVLNSYEARIQDLRSGNGS